MGNEDAGTQLTHLSTGRPVDSSELERLYEYPAQSSTYMRANMIGSLDGAATLTDRSGGLGGSADREVFAVLRAACDVILVGAGTVRAEGYGGAHLPASQRRRRQERGQHEVPAIAVVTASGAIDPTTPLFTESESAPIVITTPAGAKQVNDRAPDAELIVTGKDSVDLAAALRALAQRGMTRVLCEGGPTLLGSLLTSHLVDELCLTTAPFTVAGTGRRISADRSETLTSWRRVLLLGDAEDYLFTRHVRVS